MDQVNGNSLYGGNAQGAAFKGDGNKLTKIEIYVMNTGWLTGKLYLDIYSHTGTWGNGKPGTLLASSAQVDLQTLNISNNFDLVSFNFNNFQTTAGTNYFFVFRAEDLWSYGGNPEFYVDTTDNPAVYNGGNSIIDQGSGWVNYYNYVIFTVYGITLASTVVYDGGGSTGGSVPVDNAGYGLGASVTVKANTGGLVKSGYNFVGWATTSNASAPEFAVNGSNVNPPSFNMPASNVTLYAVWQQIAPCTLTYNGNGSTSGSAPTDSSSPYQSGSTVTVKGNTGNLVKTGHTFLGWSTNNNTATTEDYTQGQTFTITQNTTLYAVWQPNPAPTYTVTYNANWPNNTPGTGTTPTDPYNPYREYDTILLIANTEELSKPGYTFLGWSPTQNASTPLYKVNGPAVTPPTFNMPANNVVLYAIWQTTQNTGHKVTYNANRPSGVSGTGNVPIDNNTYQTAASVSVQANPNNLTATGHTFLGWAYLNNLPAPNFDVNGSIVSQPTFNITSDVNLYAIWSSNTNQGTSLTESLELNNDFKFYVSSLTKDTLQDWMWNDNKPEIKGHLRFTDPTRNIFFDMYGIRTSPVDDENPKWTGWGLAVTHHLICAKDFIVRGMVNSYEGAIALQGGLNPEGILALKKGISLIPKNHRACGWAPTYNPVIWLSKGGRFKPKKPNGQPMDHDTETLEIRILKEDEKWGWGNLECGNLTVHGRLSVESGVRAGVAQSRMQNSNTASYYKVNFQPAFPSGKIPVVVATAYEKGDPMAPNMCKVVDVTNEYFIVAVMRLTTGSHKHRIGSVTGEMGNPNPSQLQMRGVGMNDSAGSNHTLGSVLVSSWPTNNTQKDLYTGDTDLPKVSQPIAMLFHWIATLPTQPPELIGNIPWP